MKDSDKTEQAIQEYRRWLDGYRWSWFGTLKVTSGFPSDRRAQKMFLTWISQLEKTEGSTDFRWVRVLERGRRGTNRHFHVLIGGLRNRRTEWAEKWNSIGGDALITAYDPDREGILYMLKTMDENGDLDLDFKLPKQPRGKKTSGNQRIEKSRAASVTTSTRKRGKTDGRHRRTR